MAKTLQDYLNGIENITDSIVSDSCYSHETVEVIDRVASLILEIKEIKRLLTTGQFKGDKGDKGDRGEPGYASLAINDDVVSKQSVWSSEKLNTLNYSHENEVVTDRPFNIDSKNGYIELLEIKGHSMIHGGIMTSVTNGKGLELTTYNGSRVDTKQLLYYDESENNWKKIKTLNGNDEVYDSVEYDPNTGKSKYIKRCKIEGNETVPIEPILEYRANNINLQTYEGGTNLLSNTTGLFPRIRFHVHTKIQDNVLKNKERIANLENGLQKVAGRGSLISDTEISKRKTWSSEKMNNMFMGKPVAPPPSSHIINVRDIHLNNTNEGVINSFTIDGKTLTNTIEKSSSSIQSDGSGLSHTLGRQITPRIKIPQHTKITILVDVEKSSPELDVRLGGTYIDEIVLENGLRTYTTTVNNENGIIQPYLNNTFVSSDNVKVDVLNVVEGEIPNLTEFEGMKSVGLDDGIYIESIKADGNIFNGYLKSGTIDSSTGSEKPSIDNVISAFIYVQPGKKYSWSTYTSDLLGLIHEYDENRNYLNRTHTIYENDNAVFTGSYIRLQLVSKDTKLLFMLNEGDKKEYTPPVYNRATVLCKSNGTWNQIKELKSVNGVADAVIKHTDNKYYLHVRTDKKSGGDLRNPIRYTSTPSKDIYYLNITDNNLGEEIGDNDDILVKCDKLTPVTVNDIISVENDMVDCIGYSPLSKRIYLSIPKNTEINSYISRKNFTFIYPCVEEIYEVNPLYMRSYYPKTNLSVRGTKIIPQVEFKIETNLQSIAKENLIRLQQIESEVFKSNNAQSLEVNLMGELDNRLKRIERSLFHNEYIKQSNSDLISLNDKCSNIKISKIYGSEVSVDERIEVLSMSSDGNLFYDELEIGTIDTNTGEPVKNVNVLRSPNYIRVDSNTNYSLLWSSSADAPYNDQACVFQYDKNKKHIQKSFYDSRCKNFTPDSNCCYIKFRIHKGGHTVYFGKYSNEYKPHKSDKKTILFKDVDNNWKPITQLQRTNNTYDSIELHDNGKYYYHKRVNEPVEKICEVNNLDLQPFNNDTVICVTGIQPSLFEVKYYKTLGDMIESNTSKLQYLEDMVNNRPSTLEEE